MAFSEDGFARDACMRARANEPVGRNGAGRFVAGTHARTHGTELRAMIQREGIVLTCPILPFSTPLS
jgi:hypothetical protein